MKTEELVAALRQCGSVGAGCDGFQFESGGAKIELALAEYTGKQVIHTWMIPDTVREAKMDGGADS